MPRKPSVPSYRLHRQSGQAVVTLRDSLSGHRYDVLLGEHGTKQSKAEWKRVVLEWEANGRRPRPAGTGPADITIAELIGCYWQHVESYYRHTDGTPTGEVQCFTYALRPLNYLHGETAAKDFGPMALKAVRELMVRGYDHPKYGPQRPIARKQINARVKRIRRMFKWAVANEVLPATVLHGLQALEALKQGRTEAHESPPVLPVARAVVEETLSHLRPVVADMCRLQLETGMRPGELVVMRACDIDMTGRVWLYRLRQHKTVHHGYERVVPLGPKAQEIVKRWLTTETLAYLFSPKRAVEGLFAERRDGRKTPLWPSHLRLQAKKRLKRRQHREAGDRYTVTSYGRAVARGCEAAFPPPEHLRQQEHESRKKWLARLTPDEKAALREWRRSHSWHPHRLRHTRALEIKREAGLDAARACLGQRSPVITEMYAGLDLSKAAEIMARIG
ncbi:hypothetical protein AYO40_03070 [Planctomycetaceae bacterium SCGC AG-212-D15]|nr:hypothetical protein AYO40_03070 [Planctomycetaceae bacterium SCGC AG-212-D15]